MVRKAVFLIPKTVIRPLGFQVQIFLIRFLNPSGVVYLRSAEAVQRRRGIEPIETTPPPLPFMRAGLLAINRFPIPHTP